MLRNPLKVLSRMSQSRPVEDWQYVADIHKHLKAGDYNEALRSVIHSNLEGKVLDLQTFRNTHSRMLELKADIGYHELLYKLYREHFKPHLLMTDWMGYLIATKDAKTSEILASDYHALKLEIPKPKAEESPMKEENSPQPQKIEEPKATYNYSPPAIASRSSREGQRDGKRQRQREGQRQGQRPEIKHSIEPEEVKKLIEALFGRYSRVIVHDMEVTCENFVNEEYQDGQYDEEVEEGEQEKGDQFMDTITSISKIKIGRIEIFDSRNPNGPEKDNS